MGRLMSSVELDEEEDEEEMENSLIATEEERKSDPDPFVHKEIEDNKEEEQVQG
ncbi:Uncharacterised protein [Fusobacterium necrophorum subsp. necrophorum]|nr:Uncharacterised protein [Fusobacterium necrophorum subsp. necrophorum]